MSSLLECARALITSKPAILGALIVVPLATAARSADAAVFPYSFTSGSAFTHNPSSGDVSVPGFFQAGGATHNPLTLNVAAPVTITSATYAANFANSLDLQWQGTLSAFFFPQNNSTIKINYDFTIGLSGTTLGSVTWILKDNIGGQTLDTGTSAPLTGASNHITGSLSAPVTTALNGNWSSTLEFVWTGGNNATLSIDVPATSSIDLAVTPEPASLSVLALGTLALLTRRRRQV